MKQTTTCPTCNGTGKAPLSHELQETLKAIAKRKTPAIASDLEQPGISHGAICNRLKRLEAAGLIVRAGKLGKFILWKKP